MKNLQIQSLGEQVESALKEAISSGRLRPGDSLSIADLSRQFGVSVTPVRDAIHRLSAIGFVRVSPRKDVRVEELDGKKLRNVYAVRMALETLAIRTAAERVSSESIEQAWQTLCAAEASYASTGLTQDLLKHDDLVHQLIIQHCDNEILIGLMQDFHDLCDWAQRTVIHRHPQAVADALPEHKAILAAMRAHSVPEAENALLTHLQNTLARALTHVETTQTAQAGDSVTASAATQNCETKTHA